MKITTFQNFGKLKLIIPSPPNNLFDAKTTYMIATGIIPDDETITGDLYDADENLITQGRVYRYSGIFKNIPFADLKEGQKGYLSGKEPDEVWEVPTIKLWIKDRQKKNEKGEVEKDDPYYFEETDTKEVLLEKVKKDKTKNK